MQILRGGMPFLFAQIDSVEKHLERRVDKQAKQTHQQQQQTLKLFRIKKRETHPRIINCNGMLF